MDVASAVKAGFWVRFLAVVIDGVVLSILGAILRGILGNGIGGGLSMLANVGYCVYFWTTTGQTLGHLALKMKVVRSDGELLTMSGAAIRYVGYILAAIPFGLGFMWAGWDANKQGWHDKLAGTYVVKV